MCTFSNTKLPYQMKFVVLLPFRCIVSIVTLPAPPSLSCSLSVNLFGHCSRPWPKKAPFKPFVVVPIAVAVVVSGLFTAQHKSAPKTWRCLQPWGHDRSVREMLLNKMQVQKKKLFFCGRFISLFRVHLISFLSSVSEGRGTEPTGGAHNYFECTQQWARSRWLDGCACILGFIAYHHRTRCSHSHDSTDETRSRSEICKTIKQINKTTATTRISGCPPPLFVWLTYSNFTHEKIEAHWKPLAIIQWPLDCAGVARLSAACKAGNFPGLWVIKFRVFTFQWAIMRQGGGGGGSGTLSGHMCAQTSCKSRI